MTIEIHNYYNQYLFHSFLCALHETDLHDCTDCRRLCNTVYYAVLLTMNDYIHSKHVEQTKSME
jgi:hypothetical protein